MKDQTRVPSTRVEAAVSCPPRTHVRHIGQRGGQKSTATRPAGTKAVEASRDEIVRRTGAGVEDFVKFATSAAATARFALYPVCDADMQ